MTVSPFFAINKRAKIRATPAKIANGLMASSRRLASATCENRALSRTGLLLILQRWWRRRKSIAGRHRGASYPVSAADASPAFAGNLQALTSSSTSSSRSLYCDKYHTNMSKFRMLVGIDDSDHRHFYSTPPGLQSLRHYTRATRLRYLNLKARSARIARIKGADP